MHWNTYYPCKCVCIKTKIIVGMGSNPSGGSSRKPVANCRISSHVISISICWRSLFERKNTMIENHYKGDYNKCILPCVTLTNSIHFQRYINTVVMRYINTVVMRYINTVVMRYIHTVVMRYINTVVMRYINTVVMRYINTVVMRYINTVVMRYINTVVMRYINTVVMRYINTVVMRYINTVVMRYINTVVMRYISTVVMRINLNMGSTCFFSFSSPRRPLLLNKSLLK